MSAAFVIPPGQESLVRRMLADRVALPAGWAFAGSEQAGEAITARYRHGARGATATVRLAHPSAVSGKATRTASFALEFRGSAGAPDLAALCAGVVAAVRAHEREFAWARAGGSDADAGRADAPGDAEARSEADAQREVDHHLDLVPYIDLGLEFDHRACFEEALALHAQFRPVPSASPEANRNWKVLALRSSDGGAHTVLVPQGTDFRAPERFQLTDVAARCPHTMALVRQLVDVERSFLLQFLLLEPDGAVAVHSDNPGRTSRGVNIALNMPEGCEFFIETEPDGTHNAFTRRVPFRGGNGFALNVGKYHYVRNASDTPRIHLNLRTALRTRGRELLERARAQNGLSTRDELLRALLAKYRAMGARVDPGSALAEDARSCGLTV